MGNSIIEHRLDQDMFWEAEAERCENPAYYIENWVKGKDGISIILRPSLRRALAAGKPFTYPAIYKNHEIPDNNKSFFTYTNLSDINPLGKPSTLKE